MYKTWNRLVKYAQDGPHTDAQTFNANISGIVFMVSMGALACFTCTCRTFIWPVLVERALLARPISHRITSVANLMTNAIFTTTTDCQVHAVCMGSLPFRLCFFGFPRPIGTSLFRRNAHVYHLYVFLSHCGKL